MRVSTATALLLAVLAAAPAGASEGGFGPGHTRRHAASAFAGHTEAVRRPPYSAPDAPDVTIVEVPEPYIGRGLVYNVPPDLHGWRGGRGGPAIRARF